jgi:hypothetical protein
MQMLFPAARLALLLTLAWCLDPVSGSVSGSLFVLAPISFVFFEVLSGWIAYRRLCFRLGVLHQMWANADRFESLRFLRWTPFPSWALVYLWKPSYVWIVVRGFFGGLRGWWALQCIYEVCLAGLILGAMVYLYYPGQLVWSSLPVLLIAVAILASKRALSIYEPEKFYPKG